MNTGVGIAGVSNNDTGGNIGVGGILGIGCLIIGSGIVMGAGRLDNPIVLEIVGDVSCGTNIPCEEDDCIGTLEPGIIGVDMLGDLILVYGMLGDGMYGGRILADGIFWVIGGDITLGSGTVPPVAPTKDCCDSDAG